MKYIDVLVNVRDNCNPHTSTLFYIFMLLRLLWFTAAISHYDTQGDNQVRHLAEMLAFHNVRKHSKYKSGIQSNRILNSYKILII
jgi:hypothetical protein